MVGPTWQARRWMASTEHSASVTSCPSGFRMILVLALPARVAVRMVRTGFTTKHLPITAKVNWGIYSSPPSIFRIRCPDFEACKAQRLAGILLKTRGSEMSAICPLPAKGGFFSSGPAGWDQIRAGLIGYPSGQRGQTVNLLAYAFDGSNPSPTTTFITAAKQENRRFSCCLLNSSHNGISLMNYPIL